MDLYSGAKSSKLKLKGPKNKILLQLKKKHKKRKGGGGNESEREERQRLVEAEEDRKRHGGWWKVIKVEDVCGSLAIEFGESRSYIKCLDDGTFTLGPPHNEGEGPSPEEIFTGIKINEDKIALKSGYGKYLGVDSRTGNVVGRSDAVGGVEQWEVVFEEGRMALLAHNGYFMSIDDQEESVVCRRRKAGPQEMVNLRCNVEKVKEKSANVPPEEEAGSLKDVEVNYVKKFQKFQDKKMRLCKEDLDEVKKAKEEGKLHEQLLDRRSKMKADRYCK